ncbi:MAG: GNAT family N-acetyltransferase [Dehalococcoidia bacterium]
MSAATHRPAARGPWARGLGISLVAADPAAVLADPALRGALADGIEHGHEGPLHEFPDRADWYLVREGGEDVGVAVVQRDYPAPGEAALFAVAIAPGQRGRAIGTKAMLVMERRLRRDGIRRVVARVPRTNGRGLYFMLRAGYTPLPPESTPVGETGDVTWFARGGRS